MTKAGNFEIEVSAPHPCWIRISYQGQQIHGIRHTELRDLEYAVRRAIFEAREKLPESYKHEMD